MGVAKNYSISDVSLLEACVRDDLNKRSLRRMAVLRPLKVVIDNYPDSQVEEMEAVNNPEDPNAGTRKVPFSKVVYIEQEDFRETPPPKYYRLFPGNEVRLALCVSHQMHACCEERSKAKWLKSIARMIPPRAAAMRPMDARSSQPFIGSLPHTPRRSRCESMIVSFTKEDPEEGEEGFLGCLNPNSLTVLNGYVEPLLSVAKAGDRFQFERQGYFCATPTQLPTNRFQFDGFTKRYLGKDREETISQEPDRSR